MVCSNTQQATQTSSAHVGTLLLIYDSVHSTSKKLRTHLGISDANLGLLELLRPATRLFVYKSRNSDSSIAIGFHLLYYNAKFFTYADDGTTIAACTREELFPLGSNTNTSAPITSALQTCLSAICAPITLNPDLAGIGVRLLSVRLGDILTEGLR